MSNAERKLYAYDECIDGLRFARRRKTQAFYANKLEMYFRLMIQERDELYAALRQAENGRDGAPRKRPRGTKVTWLELIATVGTTPARPTRPTRTVSDPLL